jgi:hypothetical protein
MMKRAERRQVEAMLMIAQAFILLCHDHNDLWRTSFLQSGSELIRKTNS